MVAEILVVDVLFLRASHLRLDATAVGTSLVTSDLVALLAILEILAIVAISVASIHWCSESSCSLARACSLLSSEVSSVSSAIWHIAALHWIIAAWSVLSECILAWSEIFLLDWTIGSPIRASILSWLISLISADSWGSCVIVISVEFSQRLACSLA